MTTPDSMPFEGRDKDCDALVALRTYAEPVRQFLHDYQFVLCRATNQIRVVGLSGPIREFVGDGGRMQLEKAPVEVRELVFILNSIYDLDLGLETTKQKKQLMSELKEEFLLPTPTDEQFRQLMTSPIVSPPNLGPMPQDSVLLKGRPINVHAANRGTINVNEYRDYFDDQEILNKFNQPTLARILNAGGYEELVNDAFHFGLLMPQGTQVRERFDRQATTLFTNLTTPEGREIAVASTYLRRSPADPHAALRDRLIGFRRDNLGLMILDSTDPQHGFRSDNQAVFGNLLGRQVFKVRGKSDKVRTWRHYISHPTPSQSHFVMACIDEDVFTALYLHFPTRDFDPDPDDLAFARQFFTAASFSSLSR